MRSMAAYAQVQWMCELDLYVCENRSVSCVTLAWANIT